MPGRVPPEELPPLEPPADDVRELADDVLGRPAFDEPPEPLFERLADFVLERLGQAFSALTGGGRGALVAWLILAVTVAVVAALAFRVVATVRRDRTARQADGGERVESQSVDWRAAAALHEAKGEWRDALRCRWRALVADLAGRRVVEEVDGRTAGEYLAQVRVRAPDAGDAFSRATSVFEASWYGARPTGPDDVARVRELAEKTVESAS